MKTPNNLKGDDIMGLEQDAPEKDKGIVEIGSDPKTHPLRRGRIKTASEIAEVIGGEGQQAIDPVVFKSVSSMEGRE